MAEPPVGGAPGGPTAGSDVKVWDRAALTELKIAAEELLDEDIGGGLRERRTTSQRNTTRSSGRVAVQARPRAGGKSIKTLIAAQGKMRDIREDDQKGIRERAERIKQVREQRYERLVEELMSQDELKCNVASTIRHQNQMEFQKQANIYGEWNKNCFGKIQSQMTRHLNPPDRGLQKIMRGSKSVGWLLPEEEFRPRISDHSDPAKKLLQTRTDEESFRRTAESIIFGRPTAGASFGSRSTPDLSDGFDPFLFTVQGTDEDVEPGVKARSKPTLEPTMWEQRKLQDTPYGHFAQAAEASNNGISRTQLKQGSGVFIPNEADGVPCAGKRRTRFERNSWGVLQGEFAQRGELIQFKKQEGGGSGAPGQDHYLYEGGARVTDKEFPLGKKMFAHMH